MQVQHLAAAAVRGAGHRRSLLARIWRARNAYAFIAPFYISFLVFGLGPILFSFYFSLIPRSGFDQIRFPGLHNSQALSSEPLSGTSLGNTTYLVLGHIL